VSPAEAEAWEWLSWELSRNDEWTVGEAVLAACALWSGQWGVA